MTKTKSKSKVNEKFYLSTAIVYTSKKPHIGNDYEIILTDSIARYNRLVGKDVFMLTGTDEHGQKIEQLAQEKGVNPQKYVDDVYALIKDNYKNLAITNDDFIRTSDQKHKKIVQKIFKKLYDSGDIYKGEYEGHYCTPCEAFWTESQLVEGCCPDCNRPVQKAKEEAYFFKMSKYQDRLLKHFEDNEDFILPRTLKTEMINNFLKPGLQDLCVSRTTFSWGIPVDFDSKHIVYVWLDALTNYITALGYDPDGSSDKFNNNWPCDVHIIGKDIVRFHSIYWPIMLMALGLELPKTIFGHQWLLFGGDKMSKSKGNVLYSDELVKTFGLDAVRYYVLSEIPYDRDGSITYENIISKINSELVNTLGNLLNRTVAMTQKYFEGVAEDKGVCEPFDEDLKQTAMNTIECVNKSMTAFKISDAIACIMTFARRCNKYIDETMPWVLAKDEANKDRLSTVLFNLLESLRVIAVLLSSFTPETSKKILDQIGSTQSDYQSIQSFAQKTSFKVVQSEPIFARIDEKQLLAELCLNQKDNEQKQKNNKLNEVKEKNKMELENKETSEITIDDFAKVQLKIAEVVACEKVEKSDKLLKLTVKLGEEQRTVVSGIAKHYSESEMVGKKVVLVANLKPTKLRGIMSEGMVLCASDDKDNVIIVSPEKDIESGSEVF